MAEKLFTRREVIIGSGAATVGLFVGLNWPRPSKSPSEASVSSKPNTSPVIVSDNPTFIDNTANEVARSLDINMGTFFHVPEDGKLVGSLKAMTDRQLFPIYPPAVLARKDLIYQLADEYSISPNIIATIMSVESLGFQEAGSWAGAIGLFQPLQDKFPLEMRVKASDDSGVKAQKEKMMQDPIVNGRAGMNYFKDQALLRARKENNFSENDARIYARAFIAYNAGSGNASTPFEGLPQEAQLYGDHFIRYALTAEIALGLRGKGYSDKQIVDALSSVEIDARAYALSTYLASLKRDFKYVEYNQACIELSATVLPKKDNVTGVTSDLGKQLFGYSEDYKRSPTYKQPISPGLRIYLAIAPDLSLYYSDPRNQESGEWYKYSTAR